MIFAAIVTPGSLAAVLVGLALASWNLFLTRRERAPSERIQQLDRLLVELRSELKHCRRVNRWLRMKNELVAGALLRLLPERDRLELLAELGDQLPTTTTRFELDDDDRAWLDRGGDDDGEAFP